MYFYHLLYYAIPYSHVPSSTASALNKLSSSSSSSSQFTALALNKPSSPSSSSSSSLACKASARA